jgi:hypothetical protein
MTAQKCAIILRRVSNAGNLYVVSVANQKVDVRLLPYLTGTSFIYSYCLAVL